MVKNLMLVFDKEKAHKNIYGTYPQAAHMHLVTYAYLLKSNHESVQLEELIYTKVTLHFKVGVEQATAAHSGCQPAKPSLTP